MKTIPAIFNEHGHLVPNEETQNAIRTIFDGTNFIIYEEGDETPVMEIQCEDVVPSLNRRQLRYALMSLGVSEANVLTAIQAIPDSTQRLAAQIEWEDSPTYYYKHPLVVQIGGALGFSEAQIAEAFKSAFAV